VTLCGYEGIIGNPYFPSGIILDPKQGAAPFHLTVLTCEQVIGREASSWSRASCWGVGLAVTPSLGRASCWGVGLAVTSSWGGHTIR